MARDALPFWDGATSPKLFDMAVVAFEDEDYGVAQFIVTLGIFHALAEIELDLDAVRADGVRVHGDR